MSIINFIYEVIENIKKVDNGDRVNAIAMLNNLSDENIKNLYYRIWRSTDDEFCAANDLDIIAFRASLKLDPLEVNFKNYLINYFKNIIKGRGNLNQKLSQYRKMLLDIHPRFMIFLDIDNYSVILDDLFKNIPADNNSTLVMGFAVPDTRMKILEENGSIPWLKIIHANRRVKDSSDHVLTIAATLANEILPLSTIFYIITMDRFAEEIVADLKELRHGREIEILNRKYLQEIMPLIAQTTTMIPVPVIARKEDDNIKIPTSPEDRFSAYIRVLWNLHNENRHEILQSQLGNLVRDNGITLERGGTKEFTDESAKLGLIDFQGTKGQRMVIINSDKLTQYIKDHNM